MVLYQVIIIFAFYCIMKCATTNTSHLEVTACYDNSSSFEMVTNKPKLVDIITGSIVHLWCQFCNGKGDYYPKWWFYEPRENKKQKKILSEIENNDFSTKVTITPDHVLNIHDFNVNNSGMYTCKSPEIMKNGNVFMYILEVKHKINKDKNKNKTTKQVEENSHVILSCTEAVPNADLKWFKDAKRLNSLFRKNIKYKNEEDPHLTVDTNNSLHILHITKNEEGNYSCLSNGKKIQEFEVSVVSKSKLLNQEFIRYSIYLGFVLSLAMTCYCAGVGIAWHRRSSFINPLNVNKKGVHEYHRLQCERKMLLK